MAAKASKSQDGGEKKKKDTNTLNSKWELHLP